MQTVEISQSTEDTIWPYKGNTLGVSTHEDVPLKGMNN